MEPAKPPLPTPWNLPVHPEAGIQTSNWMFESSDGLITPATRQNAGTSPAAGLSGGVYGPAGTATAAVIVVAGSESFDNSAHGVPAANNCADAKQVKRVMAAIWNLITIFQIVSHCGVGRPNAGIMGRMRNFGPVALFIAFATASLAAQDSSSKLAPPIQQALDRIAKGDSWGQGAQSTWARSTVTAVQPPQFSLPPEPVCSVPLIEMHVDKPQRFTIQQVAPPSTGDRMPMVAPAPACGKDDH
jgi:hypothetical protein